MFHRSLTAFGTGLHRRLAFGFVGFCSPQTYGLLDAFAIHVPTSFPSLVGAGALFQMAPTGPHWNRMSILSRGRCDSGLLILPLRVAVPYLRDHPLNLSNFVLDFY